MLFRLCRGWSLFSSSSRIYDGYSGILLSVFTYIYIMAFLYSRVAPFSFVGRLFYSFLSLGFWMHSGWVSCSRVLYIWCSGQSTCGFPFVFLSYKPFFIYTVGKLLSGLPPYTLLGVHSFSLYSAFIASEFDPSWVFFLVLRAVMCLERWCFVSTFNVSVPFVSLC